MLFCLAPVSMCCSKNYHKMNPNKDTGAWKLRKKKKICRRQIVPYSPGLVYLGKFFSLLLLHLYKIGGLRSKPNQDLVLEHQ